MWGDEMNYNEKSKDELISIINNLNSRLKRKKYGIVWDYEKVPENVVIDCKNNLPILRSIREKDIVLNDSLDNSLIVGDNYHSLSVLNYTHSESIDVIYIDPPYNTLKEGFMYNDKRVNQDDSYRHSKWLNFMEKRLKLARELLKKDGVIFISIDDNEFAQLKLLCDQVFGEENLLDTFHIQVRYAEKSLNEKDPFQKLIEYVLIYANDRTRFKANQPIEDYSIDKFIFKIKEKGKGQTFEVNGRSVTVFKKGEWELTKHTPNLNNLKETWISGSIYSKTGHGKMYQNVVEPRIQVDGLGSIYKIDGIGEDGLGFRYYTGPQRKNATKGKMFSGVPSVRVEEIEESGESIKFKSIVNYYDFSADFGNIRHEGGVNFPGGKKPIKLLKKLINIHPNKDAVVLDFFAGSGSTGHAVLDLNSEDGGTRRFVLCTNNEVDEKEVSKYCKENNISSADFYELLKQKDKKTLSFSEQKGLATTKTYPRIENVIKGYKGEKSEVAGITSNLKYYETDLIKINDIRKITDKDRTELTLKAGDMISLKENTFIQLEVNEWYQIFSDRKNVKKAAIYFRENLEKFDELVEKIGTSYCSLYIYSGGKVDRETFGYLPSSVIIKDIPEPIVNIYKKINKDSLE